MISYYFGILYNYIIIPYIYIILIHNVHKLYYRINILEKSIIEQYKVLSDLNKENSNLKNIIKTNESKILNLSCKIIDNEGNHLTYKVNNELENSKDFHDIFYITNTILKYIDESYKKNIDSNNKLNHIISDIYVKIDNLNKKINNQYNHQYSNCIIDKSFKKIFDNIHDIDNENDILKNNNKLNDILSDIYVKINNLDKDIHIQKNTIYYENLMDDLKIYLLEKIELKK